MLEGRLKNSKALTNFQEVVNNLISIKNREVKLYMRFLTLKTNDRMDRM